MQQMFIKGYDHILFPDVEPTASYPFSTTLIENFQQALLSENRERALQTLNSFFTGLVAYPATLPSNIRDYSYHLLTAVMDTARTLLLSSFLEQFNREEFWNNLNRANTLSEIKAYSLGLLEQFFLACRQVRTGSSNVLRIKNYIAANYRDCELSVKQISDAMFMSMAYMCSTFKNETGVTINQYITDLRLENAKQLLKNKSYNISDVAAAVGFNDSQYFAKIFKKKTGVTPSMYKEAQT